MMNKISCSLLPKQYQKSVHHFTEDRNAYAFAPGSEDIGIEATKDKVSINRSGKNYVLLLADFKMSGNPHTFGALSIVVFESKNIHVLELGSDDHEKELKIMKALIIKKRDAFPKGSEGIRPLNTLIIKINFLLDYLDLKKSCQKKNLNHLNA